MLTLLLVPYLFLVFFSRPRIRSCRRLLFFCFFLVFLSWKRFFLQMLSLQSSQTDKNLFLTFGAKLTSSRFGSTHVKYSISTIMCKDNDKKKLILGRRIYHCQQTNNQNVNQSQKVLGQIPVPNNEANISNLDGKLPNEHRFLILFITSANFLLALIFLNASCAPTSKGNYSIHFKRKIQFQKIIGTEFKGA